MRIRCRALTIAAVLLAPAAESFGQATIEPSAGATVVPNDGATLYRVESGVFQIDENQTVDLTDRSIFFAFSYERDNEKAWCSINGEWSECPTASQMDFKRRSDFLGRCCGSFRGFEKDEFKSRERCVLSVVNINAPSGAPATGVFRLDCL